MGGRREVTEIWSSSRLDAPEDTTAASEDKHLTPETRKHLTHLKNVLLIFTQLNVAKVQSRMSPLLRVAQAWWKHEGVELLELCFFLETPVRFLLLCA